MRICHHWSKYPPRFHFEHHESILSLHASIVGVLGPPLLLNFDFDAVSDPDPAFDFDVDPEPAFFSHRVANADMDPSSQNDAYPDPQH
jgi:hypothetical protein